MVFVKCTAASGAYKYLTEGRVYKVLDESDDCYLLDENTNYWNKGRFEITEERL